MGHNYHLKRAMVYQKEEYGRSLGAVRAPNEDFSCRMGAMLQQYVCIPSMSGNVRAHTVLFYYHSQQLKVYTIYI